tara:strand:- start:862 stop:1359 length:498 start_codon:yes stop_codon:yes gene_type:complete
VLELYASFELTGFSTAVRELWWVFPTILVFHSLSMGLMAGIGIVCALRALGFARQIPIAMFSKFQPLLWVGLGIAGASGLLLLAGYPAKALTNPLFFIKMLMLAGAIWLTVRMTSTAPRLSSQSPSPARLPALLTIGLWLGVIASGRFLAYTHTVLLASWLVVGG